MTFKEIAILSAVATALFLLYKRNRVTTTAATTSGTLSAVLDTDMPTGDVPFN